MELKSHPPGKKRGHGISEGWVEKRLDEIGTFIKGKGISRSEAQSGTIPCIRYGEIYTQHTDIIRNFYSFISREVAQNAVRLQSGDILFTCSGETKEDIGKSVAFTGLGEAYAGGDIIILRNTQECPEFLGYRLNAGDVTLQKSSAGQGDAVVHISAASLGAIRITLPPNVSEQKAIASALSDVDALLTSLDALISKKRDIKKAAMQELLTGKKRLPGFSGEWVEKPLSSLAMIVGGGTPSTREPSYWYGSIPWFTPAEISTAGKYVSQSERQISELGLENSSAKLLPVGAILLTTRASIGFRAILTVPAATNQGFQSLIVHRNTDNEFIYYLLEIVQSELLAQASGSTFLEISPRKLGAISLRLPPSICEQRAIAVLLSDMDAEIAALVSRRAKVQSLKQGMMQELLTGRTRLLPAGE